MNHAAMTGFSLRTPFGSDIAEIVRRIFDGQRAAAPNAHFDASTYACRLAATIPGGPRPTKHRKFVKRMGLWGMEAGAEALARSGTLAKGTRLGVFCGYGGLRAHWEDLMPVLERQSGDAQATGAWANGFSSLHPFWMLFHLSNNAHALLSIDIGAKGDGTTTAGGNAGAQALRAAIVALSVGSVDVALVFTYDSLVEPETLLSLGASGAGTWAEVPEAFVTAYQSDAAGLLPGEAAAAVVLERSEEAGERSIATISADVAADGAAFFAGGETIAAALGRVWQGETIVDGAALGEPGRDAAEREAIAGVMGPSASLSAMSSSLGHLGGATAVVQAIFLAHVLRNGVVPPIAGLRRAAEGPLVPLVDPLPVGDQRSAVAVSAGMPGLAGALRVEVS